MSGIIVRTNERYIGRQRKLWVHCSFRMKSYSTSIQRGQNCSMPTLSHSSQNKANYDQILANKVTGSVARRNAADIIKLGFTEAIDKISHHSPIRNAQNMADFSHIWNYFTTGSDQSCTMFSLFYWARYFQFSFFQSLGPRFHFHFLRCLLRILTAKSCQLLKLKNNTGLYFTILLSNA